MARGVPGFTVLRLRAAGSGMPAPEASHGIEPGRLCSGQLALSSLSCPGTAPCHFALRPGPAAPGQGAVCLGALSTPPGLEVGACDCSPVCGVSTPVPGLCQLPPGAEATPEASTNRGCGPLGPSGPLGLTRFSSHGSPEQTGGRRTDRSRQRYKYHRGSQPSQPAGPATWGV